MYTYIRILVVSPQIVVTFHQKRFITKDYPKTHPLPVHLVVVHCLLDSYCRQWVQ